MGVCCNICCLFTSYIGVAENKLIMGCRMNDKFFVLKAWVLVVYNYFRSWKLGAGSMYLIIILGKFIAGFRRSSYVAMLISCYVVMVLLSCYVIAL